MQVSEGNQGCRVPYNRKYAMSTRNSACVTYLQTAGEANKARQRKAEESGGRGGEREAAAPSKTIHPVEMQARRRHTHSSSLSCSGFLLRRAGATSLASCRVKQVDTVSCTTHTSAVPCAALCPHPTLRHATACPAAACYG